jgi:hypothetical protein
MDTSMISKIEENGVEKTKSTNNDVIKSIDYDQGVIIKNILKLHVPSGLIDCDITYSKGNFYKKTGIPKPKFKFDKFPQTEDTLDLGEFIPLDDESIDTIMVDLPFIIQGNKNVKEYKTGSCIIGKRFSGYRNINELLDSYQHWINESHRVLKPNGILIFKTQDQISGGIQYLLHNYSHNMAVKVGFYPKDLFILLAKNRIISPKHANQQHGRKYHSYFQVFKKEDFKNFYFGI